MCRLLLTAASDDYLLEQSLAELSDELAGQLPGCEPEILPAETTPEDLAMEIQTPSLFAAQRLLVLKDVRSWLDAAPPADAPKTSAPPELRPLLHCLENGIPDGVGVVLGAWCGGKPKGDLVQLISARGGFRWIPLPPPPKPWEEVSLSEEQRAVLRGVVQRNTGSARFTDAAERILLDRLGFAPRLLAQEVAKLVTAAGDEQLIDEELVRRLSFPRERSLEVVRDAILARNPTAVLDLIAAASTGVPVRDWRGQRVDSNALAPILFGQVFSLLSQLLELHRVARPDLTDEMEAKRCSARGWYGRVFRPRLAPALEQRLAEGGPSPLRKGSKPPSTWTLGQLFAGAGRYPETLLVAALAEGGEVEARLRGACALDALSAWLTTLLTTGSASAPRP